MDESFVPEEECRELGLRAKIKSAEHAVIVHSPAGKRGPVNNNTLRDAQKWQKAPFRAV